MVNEYLWIPCESYCFPYTCWNLSAFYSGGPYQWPHVLVSSFTTENHVSIDLPKL